MIPIYPFTYLETPVVVTTAVDTWTLGNFIGVVPVGTIANPFSLHYLYIENLDDDTIYEIVLYAVDVEIVRIRVTNTGHNIIPTHTIVIAAGSPIRARTASAMGSSVVTLGGIFYYEHVNGDEKEGDEQ